jgi:hypothetical protein
MEKETATEWLFKQLWEEPKDKFTWNAILSKAKEMEKQQHSETWVEAVYWSLSILKNKTNLSSIEAFEQYYNETFNSTNK